MLGFVARHERFASFVCLFAVSTLVMPRGASLLRVHRWYKGWHLWPPHIVDTSRNRSGNAQNRVLGFVARHERFASFVCLFAVSTLVMPRVGPLLRVHRWYKGWHLWPPHIVDTSRNIDVLLTARRQADIGLVTNKLKHTNHQHHAHKMTQCHDANIAKIMVHDLHGESKCQHTQGENAPPSKRRKGDPREWARHMGVSVEEYKKLYKNMTKTERAAERKRRTRHCQDVAAGDGGKARKAKDAQLQASRDQAKREGTFHPKPPGVRFSKECYGPAVPVKIASSIPLAVPMWGPNPRLPLVPIEPVLLAQSVY